MLLRITHSAYRAQVPCEPETVAHDTRACKGVFDELSLEARDRAAEDFRWACSVIGVTIALGSFGSIIFGGIIWFSYQR